MVFFDTPCILQNILYVINIYVCATPVSLAVFVEANVCDNVRLQHLQDCLYYRIQDKGNRSRGRILMRDRFILGVGKRKSWGIDCGYIWPVGGSDA